MFIYQNMQSYSTLKRSELSCQNVWYYERNKSEKTTYCMIPLYDNGEKVNYGDRRKFSGCQEWGEGWIGVAQRVVRAVKKYSLWGYYVGCIIYLSKPIDSTTPRVSHSAHYRLLVIMHCQCNFISCNIHITLVGNTDNGVVYM